MAYIEKHKLMSRIETEALRWGEEYDLSQIMGDIEDFPEADVAEVKHAKWEINCDGYYPYCGHCKTEPKNGVMSNYCPECGAKMDGRSADDDR